MVCCAERRLRLYGNKSCGDDRKREQLNKKLTDMVKNDMKELGLRVEDRWRETILCSYCRRKHAER